MLFDQDQSGFLYLKRFRMEVSARHQSIIGENPNNELLLLTDTPFPRLLVTMGGNDEFREPMEVDAEEFVGVKSFRAKGKRITTLNIAKVEELEPTRFPDTAQDSPLATPGSPLQDETDAGSATSPEGGGRRSQPTNEQEESGARSSYPEQGGGRRSQQDIEDELNGQLHLFDDL